MKRWLIVFTFSFLLHFTAQAAEPLPRTIIALYDSREDHSVRDTLIHRMLEMPLNHLGYMLVYHDIEKPLPELTSDIRGILVWFRAPTELKDPVPFLDWMERAIDSGRRVVLFGHYGIGGKFRDSDEGMPRINRLLNKIGVRESNYRVTLTYESNLDFSDPQMMNFERSLKLLPAFFAANRASPASASYLRVRHVQEKEGISDLVITGPGGGYVAEGYGIYIDSRAGTQQWYLNPFLFLARAFGQDDAPKPDVTTLNGRRIFYSHIDGDGWNNVTEVEKYKKDKLIAAQVITKEILGTFPDLPFNVGIITSELDPACYGYPQSIQAAKEMLALPNVEPASHSHSHPLYWNFFADGVAAKEKRLLKQYPPKPPTHWSLFKSLFNKPKPWKNVDDSHLPPSAYIDPITGEDMNEVSKKYFGLPRSYACAPFDLNREIAGSIAYINAIAPEEKKVRLLQWSGDTSPYPAALQKAEQAGVWNINGGASRYDAEYPSYSWVAPIGLRVGNSWQVFSSNSNENSYTHSWTNRFFGFRYLQTTVNNTDTPIRLTPFNVYFHIFSGEKQASLNAVKENLRFAEGEPLIPIMASRYAAIAQGFYSAHITPVGIDRWLIEHRGELETLRFDHATLKKVDFPRSRGVIGQRHYQGSLYIALDRSEKSPVVALMDNEDIGGPPLAQNPYLIESRWNIENLKISVGSLEFTSQGFGRGDMRWFMPDTGPYIIEVRQGEKSLYKTEKAGMSGRYLNLSLPVPAILPVTIHIEKKS